MQPGSMSLPNGLPSMGTPLGLSAITGQSSIGALAQPAPPIGSTRGAAQEGGLLGRIGGAIEGALTSAGTATVGGMIGALIGGPAGVVASVAIASWLSGQKVNFDPTQPPSAPAPDNPDGGTPDAPAAPSGDGSNPQPAPTGDGGAPEPPLGGTQNAGGGDVDPADGGGQVKGSMGFPSTGSFSVSQKTNFGLPAESLRGLMTGKVLGGVIDPLEMR
jgi:hypothetical protein